MEEVLRVAIAGASGIGKHHAKWFHQAGAQVVGFLGSNAESVAATSQSLRDIFPFAGRGYCDLDQLLAEEAPDLVDVCLPNEAHFDCVKRALERGCHVLCEKPMVWHPAGPAQTRAQAQELVDLARQVDRRLGVCTQYAASLPHYLQLYEPVRGPLIGIESFYAEMETVARGRSRSAEEIWVDMGPHPLSLLLAWIPEGAIEPASLEVELVGGEARARFDFVYSAGSCRCEIVVRDLLEGQPVRRFGINGLLVNCAGRPTADGTYCSVLSSGAAEQLGEDFMSLLVAQFAQSTIEPDLVPLVPGAIGLRNLELQLQILQHA
jgi:predicted dehydrogenase